MSGGGGADVIGGGAGIDALDYRSSDSGVTVDFISSSVSGGDAQGDVVQNFEVVLGSSFGDSFTASLAANDAETSGSFSGGDGVDVMHVSGASAAPAVFWGGAGADELRLTVDDFTEVNGSAGILVVNVAGLTEQNFKDFSLDMIRVGNGFDWSTIDAVVLNPDADDKIYFNESELKFESRDYQVKEWNSVYGDTVITTTSEVVMAPVDLPNNSNLLHTKITDWADGRAHHLYDNGFDPAQWYDDYGLGYVGSQYDISFLGANVDKVFAAAARAAVLPSDIDPAGWAPFYSSGGVDYWKGYIRFAAPDIASALVQSISDIGEFDESDDMPGWFIAGGYLTNASNGGSSSLVVNSANSGAPVFNVVMPSDSDLENKAAGSSTDLSSSSSPSNIHGFHTSGDILTIDGSVVDPNSVFGAVSLMQVGNDVSISANGNRVGMLVGVSLSAWQAAAANQISGTAASDVLVGTSQADTIAGGVGDDTISADFGNDLIIYTSGDDVLTGAGPENTGYDVLDLSNYSSDSVTFDVAGSDVVITTIDGTVTLGSQAAVSVGDVSSNIEEIRFSDGSMSDAEIRIRAIGDQSTLLSDLIDGTTQNDVFFDDEGNDTINAFDGSDVIVYRSGDDEIRGGLGSDTLDLSWYSSSVARFRIVGADVLISMPGGTIRLVDQVKQAIGDPLSNIETIIFADLTLDATDIAARAISDQISTGDDSIVGTSQSDYLDGISGNDTIYGNDGSDTLVGGSGADSLLGGAGDDTYIVDVSGDQVVEAVNEGFDLVQAAVSLTLSANVENLLLTGGTPINGTGNALDNILTGNVGANVLDGLDGSDALFGDAGNDSLVGGNGNDSLDGGAGTDTLVGGAGDDVYVVDSASDVVTEGVGGGIDTIVSSVTLTLGSDVENLTLSGTATIDANGNSLNNVLAGNSGNNYLYGYTGNDTIFGGGGNDTINAFSGDDTIVYVSGDVLVQGSAVPTLNKGFDTLDLSQFDSSQVQFKVSGFDVLILTPNGTVNLQYQVRYDLGHERSNIESIVFADGTLDEAGIRARAVSDQSTLGNDSIYGTSYDDLIGVLGGNDKITTNPGNDTIVYASGNDIIDVHIADGTGFDTLDLSKYLASQVQFKVNGWNVLVVTPDGTITLDYQIRNDLGNVKSNIERVLFSDGTLDEAGIRTRAITDQATSGNDSVAGTTFNDIVYGLAGDDTLKADTGNDTLYGGDGNDSLDGGAGADSLVGGAGNDIYAIDNAGDVVVEVSGAGTDLVQSSLSYTLTAEVENLTLTGTSALNGTGNTLANTLTGNSGVNLLSGLSGDDLLFGLGGNDTLLGGDGNDLLDGGAGSDSMTGGLGDDTYVVDAATDTIVEVSGGGADLVKSSVTLTLGSEVENLTLTGTSALNGTGNGLANVLTGNAGINVLSGLSGNDYLFGAGGNDNLTGGIGADHFVFNSTTSGIDVITDFNQLDGGADELDVLEFQGLLVGSFAYLGTGAFSGGSDNTEARVAGNQVLVDTDGNGTADITITLTGLTSAGQIGVDDFLFT